MQSVLPGATSVLWAAAPPAGDLAHDVGFMVGRVIGIGLFIWLMCHLVHKMNNRDAKSKKKGTRRSQRTTRGEVDDLDD